MSDELYELYEFFKIAVERGEICCEKNHNNDPDFQNLKKLVQGFENLNIGYAERYEKEKQDAVV
jgi:hypothetical protein